MKDILKITAWLVCVVLLACLIAPPLYWVGQWAVDALGWEFLRRHPFQRYFNRSVLIAAVILLVPAIRYLRLNRWSEFGLLPNQRRWSDLGAGFAAAFLLLFAMGLVGYGLDVHRVQSEIRWDKLAKAPLTAVAVSLIEEGLFRGALLALILRTARTWVAVVFVSALYSIVHFLKPLKRELESITWTSGFEILPDSFHRFADPLLVLGGFATLFAIGLVLAAARLRTASLWMPIGLHAGWIMGSRTFNTLFKQKELEWPWFGNRIEIGLAPLLTVILTGVVVWWLTRGRRTAGNA